MNVLLISAYELGHQPFGLASPAAWLSEAGAKVTTADLAVQCLDEAVVAEAGLICLYVPMHTASRIAASLMPELRRMNPRSHMCFYGLYAPMNEQYFRSLGADTILGGEFEEGLVELYRRLQTDAAVEPGPPQSVISVRKQQFVVPDRSGLPELDRYASLLVGDVRRTVGYTEASRGCRHLCRHCPVVPVYNGRFRVVPREVVLEDVRRQVAGGAEHVTFGDPDFFNGPGHAVPLVEALHEEFPDLTYDVTIKIEHLRTYARYLPTLKRTGCLFVTSAVESVDDEVLERFDKRHTRAEFADVARAFREVGLTFSPTFVAFHPWSTLPGFLDLLETVLDLDLVPNVAPIQYAIRLLLPAGSRLLELAEVEELVEPFDHEALLYPWTHPDPRVDMLQAEVLAAVEASCTGAPRIETFEKVWEMARGYCGGSPDEERDRMMEQLDTRESVPHLSEPWYCCAEPTSKQVDVDRYFQPEVR